MDESTTDLGTKLGEQIQVWLSSNRAAANDHEIFERACDHLFATNDAVASKAIANLEQALKGHYDFHSLARRVAYFIAELVSTLSRRHELAFDNTLMTAAELQFRHGQSDTAKRATIDATKNISPDKVHLIVEVTRRLSDSDGFTFLFHNLLSSHSAPEVIQYLHSLLHHPDSSTKRVAVSALGRIGGPDSFRAIVDALGDTDENVSQWALKWLFQVDPSAASEFAGSLRMDSELTTSIVALMGSSGDARCVNPLVSVLTRGLDEDSRIAAAKALGKLRSHEAIEALTVALASEGYVRGMAAWALGEIGVVEPMPNLLLAAEDTNKWNSWSAQQALAKIEQRSHGGTSGR
jgi:HEAT repeat protein